MRRASDSLPAAAQLLAAGWVVCGHSTTGSTMLIIIESDALVWQVPHTLDGWRYRSLVWEPRDIPGGLTWLNDEEAAWALARVGARRE